MTVNFGKLKRLDLRSIWSNEAREFTPWLAENLQELGDVLGMDLELVDTEVAVGDFSVDLLAKDLGTGMEVVIENQFGSTDHDHFGKLITYASGYDAYSAIWIAETIRDEHRQAIEWLNQRSDSDTNFFALILEIIQIDESQPAFNFKPVVTPNKWQKATHQASRSKPSRKAEAYREYFQELIDELRDVHKFTGARVAQPQNWYTFSSGFSGVAYGSSFAQGGRARVEIYIDQGDADQNKKMFDWFFVKKEAIEAAFEDKLEWERLDDKRASRIAVYRTGSIDNDQETLSEIRAWSVTNLLKLKEAFVPLIKDYFESEGDE